MMILLTGCASAGKSTLLAALAAKQFSTVPEPGRRIVAAEQASGGTALPWVDPVAFAKRAVAMAKVDLRKAADLSPPVIFDRGLLDAAVALEHSGHVPLSETMPQPFPYDLVFLAPPWPAIYLTDGARRHGIEEGRAEYLRICDALETLHVAPVTLPLASVTERVLCVQDAVAKHAARRP